MCSLSVSNSNASVICSFLSGSECDIECDGIRRTFNSIEDFSNGINDITGKYFTVEYVKRISETHTILFQNFRNTNDSNYKLLIQGSFDSSTRIILNYRWNQVDIPDISINNISILHIYSHTYDHPVTCKIDSNYLDKVSFNDRPMNNKCFITNYSRYMNMCKDFLINNLDPLTDMVFVIGLSIAMEYL